MKIDRAKLAEQLKSLPDYPAVRDVATALWGAGEVRGAAVMIGSGFSRYCEQAAGDAVPPPLWGDFARRMAGDLYSPGSGMENGDPLRLAEEYRAALGQPSLDALIRALVPDRRWSPGAMHRDLLRLPWSDVLTTNWDTLLERAAAGDHERLYETVETTEAIARTRAPRIVKLHGSMPSVTPFIFAEEDFRTYPHRFAPFVNLAQQVLLENELVLLGFSGDDPNFLRWAGWVRDQLGTSARRIRLVGVLNLTPSRRRLLEGQNVTPIDLAPLVKDVGRPDQHRVATELFLDALKAARPRSASDWLTPSEDLVEDASVEDVLRAWGEDRRNYPGWLVAPSFNRQRLRWATERQVPRLEAAIPSLRPALAARLLVETAWRCSISLIPMYPGLLALLPPILASSEADLDRVDRLDLHLAVAVAARYGRDASSFKAALAEAEAVAESKDEHAAVAYEHCLFARDRLDYPGVEEHLEAVSGSDPAWALRRASMLAFLRDSRGALLLARQTLDDIRARRARDRNSLWLVSREAWAHIVARGHEFGLPIDRELEFGEWPLRYREAKSDPWDEFTNYDHELDRAGDWSSDSSSGQSPFSPGAVTRTRDRIRTATMLTPFDELTRVIDRVGFARMPNVDTVERRLQAGVEFLDGGPLGYWSALLTVRDHDKGLINRRFNRLAIAKLEEPIAGEMIERLRASIDYGRVRLYSQELDDDGQPRSTKWPDRLRTLLELLSRLVVRLDEDRAIEMFRWGCRIAHDPAWSHWWLFQSFHHLLDRLLDAISPQRRGEVAGDVLHLPIPGEKPARGMERDWPNVAERLNAEGVTIERIGPDWHHRISVLANLARSTKSLTRSRAMIMLYVLHKKGILTDEEQRDLAAAAWSVPGNGSSDLPGGVDLLPHIFLELPEPEPGVATRAFRASIIAPALQGPHHLNGRTIAASAEAHRAVRLSEDEARLLGARLLDWRAFPIDPNLAAERGMVTDRVTEFNIAGVMARAVLPAMADADIDSEFVERLFGSIETIGAEMNEVMPWLVKRRPALADRAFAALRRALVSRKVNVVYAASRGMWQWLRLAKRDGVALPTHVSSEIVALAASRREPALRPALSLATHLVAMGLVEPTDQDRLVETLDILFVETAYDNQDERDLRQDTLTLVRANCARLAASLRRQGRTDEVLGRWLDAAPSDPLPEVRFALEMEDD